MASQLKNLVCPNPKCKETIKRPILLTDWSKNPADSYYACPRCLTKLDIDHDTKETQERAPVEAKKAPEAKKEEKTPVAEKPKAPEKPSASPESEDVPPGCPYHFGYLSKRPKDTSIPEECLTCRKMVRCMLGS